MLNTNSSQAPSIAQQLQGMSHQDIAVMIAKIQLEHQNTFNQQQVILDQQAAILASHSDEIKNKDLKISQLTF